MSVGWCMIRFEICGWRFLIVGNILRAEYKKRENLMYASFESQKGHGRLVHMRVTVVSVYSTPIALCVN